MVILSHTEKVEAVVYGAPPGPNGFLYIVEPGKPTRVPDVVGNWILNHLSYTGVVRVQETENDDGITYDVKGAVAESKERLAEQDRTVFQAYVNGCVEDYIKRNKPVPPPPERILKIIERRGYDLKKFGIVPIGWEEPEKEARVTQLESENAALKNQLADLSSKMDLIVQQMGIGVAVEPGASKSKGK